MALIKCSECGKEVSDKAAACPFCGNPLNDPITTVQLTSKRWKVVKLVGWVLFIVGGLLFLSGYGNGGFQNTQTGLGFSLTFIGVVILLVGKLGAWWTNK